MPTWGIPAPQPRARLLLALFLPFLMQGGGIALATAKPLNLSQSSTIPCFLTPALLPPPDFLACGRRLHWEALPRATPHGEK